MQKRIEKGIFITLEGIEGAGKSTHMAFLEQSISAMGRDVVLTREPGGTELGEAIRSTLLSNEYKDKIGENAELLLMFAARAQHINEVIAPALAEGKVVICDRFTDSSFAYQGGGRGIALEKIERLKNWVQEDLQVDLTFLFDLPVERGLQRAGKRGPADRFESETVEFFQAVRKTYLDIASQEPLRVSVINASDSIDDIQRQLSHMIKEIFS